MMDYLLTTVKFKGIILFDHFLYAAGCDVLWYGGMTPSNDFILLLLYRLTGAI